MAQLLDGFLCFALVGGEMLYIDSLCFSLETLCRKIIQDSKQKPENYSGISKKNTSVQVQVKMNQKCFLATFFSKNSHQVIKKVSIFFMDGL